MKITYLVLLCISVRERQKPLVILTYIDFPVLLTHLHVATGFHDTLHCLSIFFASLSVVISIGLSLFYPRNLLEAEQNRPPEKPHQVQAHMKICSQELRLDQHAPSCHCRGRSRALEKLHQVPGLTMIILTAVIPVLCAQFRKNHERNKQLENTQRVLALIRIYSQMMILNSQPRKGHEHQKAALEKLQNRKLHGISEDLM